MPPDAGAVEQKAMGTEPAAALVRELRRLGVGFKGHKALRPRRNPSDNSLAVGPDHIVQTVNSRMAIFTKKGKRFDTTGQSAVRPGEHRTTSFEDSAARARRATTATRWCGTTSSPIAG